MLIAKDVWLHSPQASFEGVEQAVFSRFPNGGRGTTSDVEIRECVIGGGRAPYIRSVCCTTSDKSEGAELEEMTLMG